MSINIAPFLVSNDLGILTTLKGSLKIPSPQSNWGAFNITNVAIEVAEGNTHAKGKLANDFKWMEWFNNREPVYRPDNGQDLFYKELKNPIAGASACFETYNGQHNFHLITSEDLTGCTAIALVLDNGAMFIHSGNNSRLSDEVRGQIIAAGGGGDNRDTAMERAYRGWAYQLIYNQLTQGMVPPQNQLVGFPDTTNANVRTRLGENVFNDFANSANFCQAILQLDAEIALQNGGRHRIKWGTMIHHFNNDPQANDSEQRSEKMDNREICIQTYDMGRLVSGSFNLLFNRPTAQNITISTLACSWQISDDFTNRVNDLACSTLTSRRIRLNA